MEFLTSGGLVVDIALGVLAIEAAVIWRLSRRGGRLRFADVAPFLVAGAGLLLALRAALVGWPAEVVLLGLTLSGVAHAVDLMRRLRS